MSTLNDPDACCPACASTARQEKSALVAACTLGTSDLTDRIARIRELAARSLLRSQREPLILRLTYAPDALAEVTDLVEKEADCCGFFTFDIQTDDDAVHLTITAPRAAAEAADELFSHFASELAKVAS